LNFIVPSWFISSYYVFTMIFYFLLEYMRPALSSLSFVPRDQEPIEFILSIGFLLFCISNFDKLNKMLK